MTPPTPPARLVALDALRGFTILAMIVVNTPGSWAHVYPPLRHAAWHGVTPTDYIFPFFLFIVGVSIVAAYRKRLAAGTPRPVLVRKILWRSLKIFAVGVLLWLWPAFNWAEIRWAGVLQRIALVFLACALLYLYTRPQQQLYVGAAILLLYWIVMALVPVPGIGPPDLSVPLHNWAHYLDSLLLPGVMWEETWDPEGLLTTLPAIVTGISGLWAGHIILGAGSLWQRLTRLFVWGVGFLILGGIWEWGFPYNKHLWTSSYVLHSAGLACLALATSTYLITVRGYVRWTQPGIIFGANAITAYVLAGILTAVFYSGYGRFAGLNVWWMEVWEAGGLPLRLASLVYALLYAGVIFIPIYWLYRKQVFLKL